MNPGSIPRLILTVVLAGGCTATDAPTDPAVDGADGKADGSTQFVVNGHALSTRERQWMQYVASHVIPDLPGTRTRKLEIASRTAWWSLKEGIFDTSNPPKYSNCNTSSGDTMIGPLASCGAGRAWQVGLAAVQVPNHSLAELETLAQQLYPDQSVDQVLLAAAAEAGYDASTTTATTIAGSSGSLRTSWLLRNSAIGFTACERNEVVPECITGSLSWCYGTGWDTTRLYAPSKTAALRAIGDISHLLDQLSSTPTTPWIGSTCHADPDCAAYAGFCFLPPGATSGFCSLACEGYCPDQAGRAPTFCVDTVAGGGMCTVKAGSWNHDCTDLPGTQPYWMDRYVGTSGVPAAGAEVCAF